jgi:hypothetical protein
MGYLLLTSGTSGAVATVQPAGIASAEAFGGPVIASRVRFVLHPALHADLYPEGEEVRATGIPSAEAFGVPAIGIEARTLSIASAEAFGKASVSIPLPQRVAAGGLPPAWRAGKATVIRHITPRREEEEAIALLLAA